MAIYVYVISINLTTLLCYGYDKHQAQNNRFRIPETVLHVRGLEVSDGNNHQERYCW